MHASNVPLEKHGHKRILLFSDGTGNSSGKLFKTNVWQLYQAADLGPLSPGNVVQIGFYNNGVGTSTFRPLAIIGGIFGFGLKSSILNLYRFLCRNYQPGDEILVFGFSRGAFTIRMLVEMITSCGIVKNEKSPGSPALLPNAELHRQSNAVYRTMLSQWRVNTPAAQWIRAKYRSLTSTKRNSTFSVHAKPPIQFVGVWDTVAAYGGPIVEITRAIDDWISPLTMPNYKLNGAVRCARHALALDDARDSFQPLLWDELEESAGEPARLKQVWFSGMHADVGGGYPDDSLSYVSLTWMIEELGSRVRLLPDRVKAIYDLSNDFGPIHNSRHGLGAYYRYQPRRIAALLDPASPTTLSLRDPNQSFKGAKQQTGLIRKVHVHESVIRRIISGTDGYAPIALTRKFDIVRRGEASPHAGHLPALPLDLEQDLQILSDQAQGLPPGRVDPLDRLWDGVWLRRVTYFATVALSICLALAIFSELGKQSACRDARCELLGPFLWFETLLPGFVGQLVAGWRTHFLLSLALAVLIFLLIGFGTAIENRLHDDVHNIWAVATRRISLATHDGQTELRDSDRRRGLGPLPTLGDVKAPIYHRLRTSFAYQRAIQLAKWRWAPKLFGPAMIYCSLWCVVVVLTQARIYAWEELDLFCEAPSPATAAIYAPSALCDPTGFSVSHGQGYWVTLTKAPTSPTDTDGGPGPTGSIGSSVEAGPAGVPRSQESFAMKMAEPLLRVMDQPYLAPLALIRHNGMNWWHRSATVLSLNLRQMPDGSYVGGFVASADGTLWLFSNDVVPLLGPADLFYAGNVGRSLIKVNQHDPSADHASRDVEPAPALPKCLSRASTSTSTPCLAFGRRAPSQEGPRSWQLPQ